MLDPLLRDLKWLGKSEAAILEVWLELAMRRGALLLAAILIGAFGLAMLDLAGFFALQASWGAIDAAAMVGVGDIALAGALVFLAGRSTAGARPDFALEVRREAMAAITSDAAALEAPLVELRGDIRATRDSVRAFLRNPLGIAGAELLVRTLLALIRALKTPAKPDATAP